jgi:hypothetical protein
MNEPLAYRKLARLGLSSWSHALCAACDRYLQQRTQAIRTARSNATLEEMGPF